MSIPKESIQAACVNGDVPRLRELLQTGTNSATASSESSFVELDPSVTDEMLVNATDSTNAEMVEFVLSTYPQTTITEEVIRHAISTHSIPVYRTLLSHNPKIAALVIYDGRESQLGRALSTRAPPEYVEFLLSSGVNPNPHIGSDAISPLCLTAPSWQTRSVELCAILLNHGATLKGSGALAAAARSGNKDLVGFLLKQGADVNDVEIESSIGQRWPALHTAVEARHADIVRDLMNAGADRNILDAKGRTALAVVEKGGDGKIVSLLHSSEGST